MPGSGQHHRPPIDRAEVARLRAEVDGMLRPLAKIQPPSKRDRSKERARDILRTIVDELVTRGWSKRGLSRHLGVDVHYFVDLLEGNRAVPGWIFVALPPMGRALLIREIGDGLTEADLESIDDVEPQSAAG